MSALPGSAEGTAVTGLDSSPVEASPEVLAELPPLTEQCRAEAREIIARYPEPRSALLVITRIGYSADQRAIELTDTYCRDDYYDFVAELRT